ncbi:unnamed protein product [Symbiodinium sp. CCMP2592]|nr:unnamed protein product [Symbiodinium sp. CCMP2592]
MAMQDTPFAVFACAYGLYLLPFIYLLLSSRLPAGSKALLPWQPLGSPFLGALIFESWLTVLYMLLRLAVSKLHWKLKMKPLWQHKDDLLRMAYLNVGLCFVGRIQARVWSPQTGGTFESVRLDFLLLVAYFTFFYAVLFEMVRHVNLHISADVFRNPQGLGICTVALADFDAIVYLWGRLCSISEEKKDIVFYAFQQQVPGTEPVFDYWNPKENEHTFHMGDPWPSEEKGKHPVFYAYPLGDDKKGEKKHTFHLGDARAHEDKHEPHFLAFREPLTWKSGVICDGAPAENRAKWLMENKGMSEAEAQAFVIGEFPNLFDKSAPSSGHFVDGKFPHTLELVKDDAGKSRLKFAVTPSNHESITMIAVHYSVNGEPGKEDMNFDINKPEEGSHTYVHVTPAFGPVCEPGCKVTYWLAAMDKGLITEMPEKACPVKENRLTWIAQ